MGSERRVPSMAREILDAAGVAAFDEIRASRGRVSGPFSVLLHDPELARRVAAVGEVLRFAGSLPAPLREAAILTTAAQRHCLYEWRYHVSVARAVGVREDLIAHIDTGRPAVLTEREASVIGYVIELCNEDRVSDSRYWALHDVLGTKVMVELSVLVGYYSMLACVLNAAGVEADENVE